MLDGFKITDQWMNNLSEAWNFTHLRFETIQEMSLRFYKERMNKDSNSYKRIMDDGFVDGVTFKKMDLVASARAIIHVDAAPEFLPWTLLLILQASDGHRLGVADYKPRNPFKIKIPTGTAEETKTIKVGKLVLFNNHKAHWMDKAKDDSIMFAALFSFRFRPTKEQAERRVNTKLKKVLNNNG